MKNLSTEQRELLRNAILLQLHAAAPLGMNTKFLLTGTKPAGFQTLEQDEFDKQLRYLYSHGMIEPEDRAMNKSNRVYLITAKGTDWLDGQNLI